MKVSIAIPCYEMNGRGAFFLDYNLNKIVTQTHPDIEVVISDHSKSDVILERAEEWSSRLNIKYCRYTEHYGSSSANTNNAIRHSSGDIIKILCQDDYLYSDHAIETIVKNFSPETQWLVSSYLHTSDHRKLFKVKHPYYNRRIYLKNTIGTHSALTIRNHLDVFFDNELIWFMDCEFYKKLFDRYGLPKVVREITMVQFIWPGQVTNTLADKERRQKEFDYLKKVYKLEEHQILNGLGLNKAFFEGLVLKWRNR